MLRWLGPVCLLFVPSLAHGQSTTEFQTRSEAIDLLLPGNLNAEVEIGNPDQTITNCEIGARPIDLSNATVTGPIGVNLSRHCDGPNASNITAASNLGGGLLSLQPVRTISVPQPSSGEGEEPAEDAPALSFMEASGGFEIDVGRDAVWWFGATGLSRDQARTPFAAATDARGLALSFGAAARMPSDTTMGAQLSLAELEGDIAFDTPRLDFIDPLGVTTRDYLFSDICGLDGGGELRDRSARLGGFVTRPLGRGFLQFDAGISRLDQTYATDVCIVTAVEPQEGVPFDPAIREVFAGTITGRPKATVFDVALHFEQSFDGRGGMRVIPSVNLAYSHTRRGRYSESEAPATRLIDAPGLSYTDDEDNVTDVDGTLPFPTGTAMTFDESDRDSLIVRLGLDSEIPFRTRRGQGSFRIGGAILRELGDGQERMRARFVEDGRADPLRFTFLGPPLDRNWGEISASLNVPMGRAGQFQLGATAIVGNKFIEAQQLSALVSMRF